MISTANNDLESQQQHDNDTISTKNSLPTLEEKQSMKVSMIYISLSALCFSLLSLSVKIASKELPTRYVSFFRALLALIINKIWMKVSATTERDTEIIPSQYLPWLYTRAISGAGGLICLFYAIGSLHISDASALVFTNPMFTLILAAIILKEKRNASDIAGCVLSFIGVIFITRPKFLFETTTSNNWKGITAALFASVFIAVGFISLKKMGKKVPTGIIIQTYMLSAIFFSSLFILTMDKLSQLPRRAQTYVAVGGTGVFGFLAQVFLTLGGTGGAAATSSIVILRYLDVVFVFIWESIFLPDDGGIEPYSIVGAVLICSSVVGTTLRNQSRQNTVVRHYEYTKVGTVNTDQEN